MSYAELLCKSCFSFLHGASQPQTLIETAAALGLSALAITDVNGVYGIGRAYHASLNYPGLKLIVGAELRFNDHPPIVLLCRNRAAYGLMCRLLTLAHADKEKGHVWLSWQQFCELCKQPESEGFVVLAALHKNTRYGQLKNMFGKYVYIPVCRYLDGNDDQRLAQAYDLHQSLNIELLATNDVYYHSRDKQRLQDIMTAIRIGKPLDKVGYQLFSNGERYLKSAKQMQKLFQSLRNAPRALENTLKIADMCTFSPSELRYYYPTEWLPSGETAHSYLTKLCKKGMQKRYQDSIPRKVDQLVRHELKLIDELNFADYFLTIYEIVDFAKQQNILCQGRGSAANSAVCYCLGITAVDPSRMQLLFERFISAERGEPPDIDVDFEHERREEVLQHVYQKYGRHRAAMVSAVVTYRKRSALREVCKAFGLDVGQQSASAIEKQFEKLCNYDQQRQAEILKHTHELLDYPRHLSIHSGGFTLSATPMNEIVPIEPARMEGRTIVQWDKYDLDILGLLKVDLLSLGMLSTIRKTLDLVNMKITDIPEGDKATYEMIQRVDTVGTFQIESRAQMSMLGRLQPKNFYDLVIEVAIVRPGPIVGKMVHPYLRRRRGEEPVVYPGGSDASKAQAVKEILERTLGVPLFQEQVMKLAIVLAGFSPGEADQLRRAIGAWRSSGSVEKMGKKLMQGLLDNGLPASFAQQLYQQIQGFAQYGFPESHAASFALIAYASCYLKCHYPAEFTCSLINSQPVGFYANHTLVDDAKRHGVEVRAVHANHSYWDCHMAGGALQLGWRIVKGLSKNTAEKMITERNKQPFTDLNDFIVRSGLPCDVLYRLAMGNTFECFDIQPRQALWHILQLQLLNPKLSSRDKCQMNLFENTAREQIPEIQPLNALEIVEQQYASFNLSTAHHPMEAIRKIYKHLPQQNIKQVRQQRHNSYAQATGLAIVRQRPPTAKGVMFCTLEDESGFLDLVIHPPIFKRYRETLLDNCFLLVSGQIQRDGHSISFIVKKAQTLKAPHLPTIEPIQYFWLSRLGLTRQ